MARFRGTVQGNRGTASRLGHKVLDSSTNGWDCGVTVEADGNLPDADVFRVYLTGGSNAHDRVISRIATVTYRNGVIEVDVNGDVTTED